MRYTNFLALTCLFPILAGLQCQAQPKAGTLHGIFESAQGWRPVVYLIQPGNFSEICTNYMGVLVDSARLDDSGRFHFDLSKLGEKACLYWLVLQRPHSRFVNQLYETHAAEANFFPLVLQKNSNVGLTGQASGIFSTSQINLPDADNMALAQLRALKIKAEALRDAEPPIDHQDPSAILQEEDRRQRYIRHFVGFADTTHSFWAAMVALRWASPVGDYERMPEFLSRQCRKWEGLNHPFGEQLCQLAAPSKLPVQTGDRIPDFPLPMASGDTVMLYRLLGKKLTILDLWASWCAPCRRENREVLAPIYEQYKVAGLEIVGYSIDNSASAWKAGIAKDGAVWLHAAHLTGDQTPFFDALRVQTIPANFLLDSEGKVVAKNLHGQTMRDFVTAWFGQ